MNILEYYIGDDPYTSLLQTIIMILSVIILRYVHSDNKKLDDLKDHINTLDKECPVCPDCKCESDMTKCPDCVCPDKAMSITDSTNPNFPMNNTGVSCPEVSCPSVSDIVAGLFPGRSSGITASGKYYDINSNEEGTLLSAYSNFSNVINDGEDMRIPNSEDLPDDNIDKMNMGTPPTMNNQTNPSSVGSNSSTIGSSADATPLSTDATPMSTDATPLSTTVDEVSGPQGGVYGTPASQ